MDRAALAWRRTEFAKMLSKLESGEVSFSCYVEDENGELVESSEPDAKQRRISELRARIIDIDRQLGGQDEAGSSDPKTPR